jgi:hypothetical protein
MNPWTFDVPSGVYTFTTSNNADPRICYPGYSTTGFELLTDDRAQIDIVELERLWELE